MSKKIDSIYMYCDRWCERCTFTRHCAVYEDESDLAPEEHDLQHKAFWDRLGENLSKAQEVLRKAAQEFGVDLDSVPAGYEEKERRLDLIKQESREHPISKLSLHYCELSRNWIKTQPGMLDRLEDLKTELITGVESEADARKKAETIKDSLAVIQWYQTFIHVKLTRALIGRAKGSGLVDDDDDQKDCDGSAKIALIAIDRSIQAWLALFNILPAREDDFLKLLAMLEQLKKMVKQEFPDAERFVRPGFDD